MYDKKQCREAYATVKQRVEVRYKFIYCTHTTTIWRHNNLAFINCINIPVYTHSCTRILCLTTYLLHTLHLYILNTHNIYSYSYLYLYIAWYKLLIRVQRAGSVPGFPTPRPKRGHVRRTGAYCSTEIRGK